MMTSAALAGSIVDSRRVDTERVGVEYPIRVENRHGDSVPVFDCDCLKTIVVDEDVSCGGCGARYRTDGASMTQITAPIRTRDEEVFDGE